MLQELLQLKYVAIFESAILMTAFIYHGHGTVWLKFFNNDDKAYRLHFISAFALFLVIPLVTLFIYGKSPVDFGLKLGDWQTGLIWVSVGFVAAAIVAITTSPMPDMKKQYPFSKKAMESPRGFVIYELMYLFFYYTGWEFLFRGFLLFSLAQIDPVMAVLVQVVPSTLLHYNHPETETWSAILAGVVFGYVAWTTGSIIYPWLMHAAFGIFTDIAIYIRWKRKAKDAA